jgi:hypothetical protein
VDDVVGRLGLQDSIRCVISRVDADKGKVFVTTKRSELPPISPEALQGFFAESALVAEGGEGMPDWRQYPLGLSTNATVTAIKDYGVVLIGDDQRTVMLAPSPDHALACNPGDEVKVRVLDVDYAKKVLIVTLLPELVKGGRTKHRRALLAKMPPAGASCEAKVILKRDRYAVVSVDGLLGFLAVADYHCPYVGTGNLAFGNVITAVIRQVASAEGDAPSESPQARSLFLTLPEKTRKKALGKSKAGKDGAEGEKDSSAMKKALRALNPEAAVAMSDVKAGATVEGVITKIKPDEMVLAVNIQKGSEKKEQHRRRTLIAKVYVTDTAHFPSLPDALAELPPSAHEEHDHHLRPYHPLSGYSVGQVLNLRVTHTKKQLAGTTHVDCSLRPCDMGASDKAGLDAVTPTWANLQPSQLHNGVVTEIQDQGLWVSLSRTIKGFVSYLDVSDDLALFARITEAKALGASVAVRVLDVDPVRHRLLLSIKAVPASVVRSELPTMAGEDGGNLQGGRLPEAGSVVTGVIDLRPHALNPPALAVQLGHRLFGRVCVTELDDPEDWQDRPLPSPQAGEEIAPRHECCIIIMWERARRTHTIPACFFLWESSIECR